MSFFKSVPYGTSDACSTADPALYPTPPGGYYACGPTGEAYYVWPAFTPPDSSDVSSPPPPVAINSPDSSRTDQTTTTLLPPVRTIKRRVTNNKKERRRTMSINKAFCDLRSAIPQIPVDTKLSKIKTLRLATSYIVHLMDVLAEKKSSETFGAEIFKTSEIVSKKREILQSPGSSKSKRTSGRTGWPQHVWSLELKHENPT